MTNVVVNPWQLPQPKPVNPADAEQARINAVLHNARFAARKMDFARLLFERPYDNPLTLLQVLFPDPNDFAQCVLLSTIWPNDGEVLRQLDLLRRPGNTPEDVLPDKSALAMRYLAIADNPRVPPSDRLKALAQYQTLMGMDPPKAPAENNTNVSVNLVTERRVFVLPQTIPAEEWERLNDPSAVKTIEATANATDD